MCSKLLQVRFVSNTYFQSKVMMCAKPLEEIGTPVNWPPAPGSIGPVGTGLELTKKCFILIFFLIKRKKMNKRILGNDTVMLL